MKEYTKFIICAFLVLGWVLALSSFSEALLGLQIGEEQEQARSDNRSEDHAQGDPAQDREASASLLPTAVEGSTWGKIKSMWRDKGASRRAKASDLVPAQDDVSAEEAEAVTVSVSMSPYKIILNAELEGALQDIQAVIRTPLPEGYSLSDFSVRLSLDVGSDEIQFKAYALRYCYLDENFLASFDREEIQEELLDVEDLAGTVTATIFMEVNPDGELSPKSWVGYDAVEILKPGRKLLEPGGE